MTNRPSPRSCRIGVGLPLVPILFFEAPLVRVEGDEQSRGQRHGHREDALDAVHPGAERHQQGGVAALVKPAARGITPPPRRLAL